MSKLWLAMVIVVSVFYLLQLFSPLRLSYDTVVLLSVAESASQGKGFLDQGHSTVYPPGYPAMVAVLEKAGLATPASLIGLNLVFLAVGLLATVYVLSRGLGRTDDQILKTIVLCLFSFVVLKHTTLAMSDVPYFGIEAGCLAAMVSAGGVSEWRGFWWRVLSAAILLLAALAVRRVGVALIPPFLWMLFSSPEVRRRIQSHRAIALTIFGLAMLGSLGIVAKTFTLHDFGVIVKTDGLLHLPAEITSYRLAELAEIATNLPAGKLSLLPVMLLLISGAVVLVFVIRGILIAPRGAGITTIFTVSYVAVLFAWPYHDTRFWLPVLPFLFTYAFQGLDSWLGEGLWWQRTRTVVSHPVCCSRPDLPRCLDARHIFRQQLWSAVCRWKAAGFLLCSLEKLW